MLKFIKHNLETIVGIEIFPVISFIIFFLFFIGTIIWAFSLDKRFIQKVESLPIDEKSDNQ